MRRLMLLAVPVMLLFTATQTTAATIAWNGAGSNDFFDWGAQAGLAPEGSFHASPVPVTSNLARAGTISDSTGFTRLVEGTDFIGNFAVGDNVLYTGNAGNPLGASNAFEMSFATAVAGVGVQITSNFYGNFTAQLEVFNGATSLGVFNVAGVMDGNEDDTSPFLGALSNALDINRAVFTLTSNTGAGLAVNTLVTTDTPFSPNTPIPEPTTMVLVGLGAAGAAIRRRRHP